MDSLKWMDYPPVIKHGNRTYTVYSWFSYWNSDFESISQIAMFDDTSEGIAKLKLSILSRFSFNKMFDRKFPAQDAETWRVDLRSPRNPRPEWSWQFRWARGASRAMWMKIEIRFIVGEYRVNICFYIMIYISLYICVYMSIHNTYIYIIIIYIHMILHEKGMLTWNMSDNPVVEWASFQIWNLRTFTTLRHRGTHWLPSSICSSGFLSVTQQMWQHKTPLGV